MFSAVGAYAGDCVVLLDLDLPDPLPVRRTTVPDPCAVLRDCIHDRRRPGHALHRWRVVLSIEDIVLEVDIRAGVVLAAVHDDPFIPAADRLPVRDHAGVDDLQLHEAQFRDRIRIRSHTPTDRPSPP